MATPKWKAGTLYPTGSLVQPLTSVPPTNTAIPNPGFESGDTDWIKSGVTIVNEAGSFAGSWHAKSVYAGGASTSVAMAAAVPVKPGQIITASCMVNASGASDGVGGQVRLKWMGSSTMPGNTIDVASGTGWRKSTVTGVAPAGATFVKLQADAYNLHPGGVVLFDNFAWNYTAPPSAAGLMYKAVQPTVGTSGNSQPTWPTTLGAQVVDNTVTWEAVSIVRITWEASPILKSGATEPTWPTSVDEEVADNTISWVAITRRATEAPNSKVVAITASKVFAADEDIIKYSATVNPLDWTSENDAGYLPSGLNMYGSNYTMVLNTYRSSLVSFSSSTFQNWQVDPDPANMSLLDAMEGIGSVFQQSAQPVAKDLFYLAALGVRTVGISVGSVNLVNGDAGMPIDPLIRAEIALLATNGYTPRGLYYPSLGQYWLAFGPNVYVYTFAQLGSIGAWSYYEFPWPVEGQAQLGDSLYLRSGDAVYKVDPSRLRDQVLDGDAFVDSEVVAEMQSHYLDMGSPGVTKMMVGFDLVGSGTASVSIGYDQTDLTSFTDDFEVPGDTAVGFIIPMPVSAVSFSMQLRYSSEDSPWEWLASNFYLNQNRTTS